MVTFGWRQTTTMQKVFLFLILLLSSISASALKSTTSEEFVKSMLEAKSSEEQHKIVEANKTFITPEWIKALYDHGEKLRQQGEYQKSIEVFDAVYRSAEKLGYQKEMAIALNQNGFVLYVMNQYKEAEALIQRAIAIAEELSDKSILAACFSNLGLLWGDQGNYELGLQYMQKSLNYSKEAGDDVRYGSALSNTGYLLFSQGDYSGALERYKEAETISRRTNDTIGVGVCLNNIGAMYDNMGHYRMALEYYQAALKLRLTLSNKPGIASTLMNIGGAYLSQGYYELALEYNQRSLDIYEKLREIRSSANALLESGNIYAEMGKLDFALEKYQKSLKIRQEISDKEGIGESLNEIGKIYLKQEKIQPALQAFNESLAIHEEMKDKEGIASALMNLGRVQYKNGNYQQALQLNQKAADLFRDIDARDSYHRALTEIGLAYWKLGKPAEAGRNFDEAISGIEAIRLEAFGGEQETKGFLEGRLRPYHLAAAIHLEQQNSGEALMYAERARSRVLLDVLQREKSDFTKMMSREEQAEEKKWTQRLQSLNSELLNTRLREPGSLKLNTLTTQLQKTRVDYESFRSKLYTVHPQLRTQQGETDPLKLPEVKSLLDGETAILEYLITDEMVYGFVVSTSGSGSMNIHTFPIPVTQEKLSRQIEAFRNKIAGRNMLFQEEARALYDLLILPASKYLKNKKNLIVIPDHFLWELPFQVLLAPSSRYLIQDYAVSYAPSIAVLREMKKIHRKTNEVPKTLLALGNPSIGNEIANQMNSLYRDSRLGPLPEAEREVKSLGKLYGSPQSSIYVGGDAGEERIKQKSDQYRILHLATHGIFDNASPLYSYLALSPSAGDAEDGLLEAREIMNLNLRAELAVLSACESARGRVGGGEGVIGLSWALFVAGVPGIVVSQWKVDSASTTELMLEFHRNLRKKLRPAVALQQAELKIQQSQQYRHPFYWAGFVPIGNTN
jgi:CHAT domain-containing protein/Flp pilus assembly protein TadD